MKNEKETYNASVYEQLMQYASGDAYPFHMPGHKRQMDWMKNVYQIDITEIDGFDDLHHAEGMLREGMQRLAAAVGAKKSYYLVNGSTCGLLAALYGGCEEGAEVGIARNCHRSVYHGVMLRRLKPVYIYPRYVDNLGITCGLSAESVDKLYKRNPKLSAVVITSPTYEGFVSDIRGIAQAVHDHGGILIVDEAHGAHLPYGRDAGLPPSAVSQDADIVVQSLHKTLPSLTQSAALHICSERVDIKRIESALRIFETSSPSYVLMAGMDLCVRYMEAEGRKQLEQLCGRLDRFYQKTAGWKELWFLPPSSGRDQTKIVFGARRFPGIGRTLHQMLTKQYHLQPEMSTPDYVLLMTMLTDSEAGFMRLEEALEEINRWLAGKNQAQTFLQEKESAEEQESETEQSVWQEREGAAEQSVWQEQESAAEQRVWQEQESAAEQSVQQEQEKEIRGRTIRPLPEAKINMFPWEAEKQETTAVSLDASEGCICGEMVYIYPPGCPFLMPGEIIGREQIELMRYYQENGTGLYALEDETGKTIRVIKK